MLASCRTSSDGSPYRSDNQAVWLPLEELGRSKIPESSLHISVKVV